MSPIPPAPRRRLARYFAGDLAALDEQPVELARHGVPARGLERAARHPRRARRARTARSPRASAGHTRCAPWVPRTARNPVALFVPCHRVIAADGTLCGYGGGLERKRWLLAHEHAVLGAMADSGRSRRGVATSRKQTELFMSRIEPAAI